MSGAVSTLLYRMQFFPTRRGGLCCRKYTARPLSRQLQSHQIKIDIFPVDLEESRKDAQLPEAVFLIQPDGADVVAAHLEIQLLEAVFSCKGKERVHQRGGGAAAPPRSFYADAKLSAMAHPLVLAGQAGRADDLAVCLGKVQHIIYRSGLTAQLVLLCGEIQRDALRAIAEVFRFAADDLQESQQRCGKLLVRNEKSSVCGAARKSPPEASDGLFSLFSYAVLPLQIVSFFMRVILTNL